MPKGDSEHLKADLEDGYAKVANLLLEGMACAPLTATELRIMLFVIRRTYSWAKPKHPNSGKLDVMTAEDMALGTGTSKRTIERGLTTLVKQRLLIRVPLEYAPGTRCAYGINPCIDAWGDGADWREARVCLREAQQEGAYTRNCVVPIPEDAYQHYARLRNDTTQSCVASLRENAYQHHAELRSTTTQNCVAEEGLSPTGSGDQEPPTDKKTDSETDKKTEKASRARARSLAFGSPDAPSDPNPEPDPDPEIEPPSPVLTPQQQAIQDAYEAFGLEGVATDPPGAKRKLYSGLIGVIAGKGIPLVQQWTKWLRENHPQAIPDGAKPWPYFCSRFHEAMNQPWTWRGAARASPPAPKPIADTRFKEGRV